MELLAIVLSVGGSTALIVQLAVYAIFARTQRSRPNNEPPPGLPFPISVLKPVCGADPGLEQNLRALLEQADTQFELIVGAAEADDPGLVIAKRMAAAYPDREVRIVSGSNTSGNNPKVRLLRYLEQFARYDWLLISDSNVRPTPSYLAHLRQTQAKFHADLVHSTLTGRHGKSFGDRLEDLHLTGWVAPLIRATQYLGHPCVIGKSMLLRRSVLQRVGGLAEVRNVLAEDYVLGDRFRRAGHTVALCPHPLPVINQGRGLTGFINRHVRWGQMRRRISPASFSAELLAQPLLYFGPLVCLDSPLRWIAVLGLSLKWSLEASVIDRLSPDLQFGSAVLLPVKDLLILALLPVSFFKRTVNWRGHRMLVSKNSVLSELPPGTDPAKAALTLDPLST